MRSLYIALLTVLTATAVYANDVLLDTELKNIRIVEIKDGKAIVQGASGVKAEVAVGDSMGREGGKVVEIEKSFITVENGATRTRIPATYWFMR